MNVYEIIVDLAEALKNCEEYRDFVVAKENLRKDPAKGGMLDAFRQKQFEVQMAELAGQEVDEEIREELEEEYHLLSQTPEINEYLNAEYRFSLVMSDIQASISQAVPEWFDFSPSGYHPADPVRLQ